MPDRLPNTPMHSLLGAPDAIFPSPFAASLITMAAVFAMALVVSLFADQPLIVSLGLGEAIGLGGVATLAARRVQGPQPERLGLQGFEPRLLLPLLCLVPVVLLLSELDNWARSVLPPTPEQSEVLAKLAELQKLDSPYAIAQAAVVGIGIAPVVEGFLFFGVLLQGMVAHLGKLGGIFITAILYAFIHISPAVTASETIVPIASSVCIGMLLCLARLATGSILAPIIVSMGLAGVSLAALALGERLAIPGFNGEGDHTPVGYLVPALAMVLFGIAQLTSRARSAPRFIPIEAPPEVDDDEDDGGFHF